MPVLHRSARRALLEEVRRFHELASPPRLLPMGEWAEREIVLPDGPYKGRKFRMDRQPAVRAYFEALGCGDLYRRHATTGPSQSGKSLVGYIIPILYHLFAYGETVVCGLPDMDMAADKWREDIAPVIEAGRFRELLPEKGAGSRGGRVDAIKFRNGATLKFMSGGGGDKSRAGFTTRVLVVTEVDGLDEAGDNSRESDKLSQLEARTLSHGDAAVIYLECTVSIEQGRIWQELKSGTDSRIVCPCPHCREWVTPEREQLVGWQEAATLAEARARAHWVCPECAAVITDAQRLAMNHACRLSAGCGVWDPGSGVRDPECGPAFAGFYPPRSPVPESRSPDSKGECLSWRYNAFNNLFVSTAKIAAEEWSAKRVPAMREDLAELKLRQFFWTLPAEPEADDLSNLQAEAICVRTTHEPRGVVPASAERFCVFIDVGKYRAHWMAVGFRPGATPHVVDYGALEVPSAMMAEEQAILTALREFRDQFVEPGWSGTGNRGPGSGGAVRPSNQTGERRPDFVGIDAGWQGKRAESYPVYQFCEESRLILNGAGESRYVPTMGFGTGQYAGEAYRAPAKVGASVAKIGERWHVARLVKGRLRVRLVEFDADHWKSWAHARLTTPIGQPGAMTLFAAQPIEHRTLAKHLTAERKVEEYKPGKGTLVKWERVHRQNHLLDCCAGAMMLGHMAGARVFSREQVQTAAAPTKPRQRPMMRMPDGRPWSILDR